MPEPARNPRISAPLGAGLFRLHIENGLGVSLGMAVVGLGTAALFGRSLAVLAATGALCASVVDQPGPPAIKARMFATAVGGSTLLTVLTILAAGRPWALGLVVAGMSFSSGLISAYGRRAIGLGVVAVLALLFGMAPQGTLPLAWHAAVFFAGGVAYALFALLVGVALDDRYRRLFLAEAVRAFGQYVAAKAELYQPSAKPRQALQSLVEAHAAFVERLQAARDMVFAGRRTPRRLRWMSALLSLLDCFDTILSSGADIETLRASTHRPLLHRFHALTAAIADDVQGLAQALVAPGVEARLSDHEAELTAMEAEVERLEHAGKGTQEPLVIAALRSTAHKLQQTVRRLRRLAQAARGESTALPDVDLSLFMQVESFDPRVLLAQFTLASPVMRYAIRLTLAMSCGYGVTLLLPGLLHGGWVLLTTALIMRASYSITKQRRNDRLLGTLAGCVAAAGLVHVVPQGWLFLPMLVTVGAAHAFAAVDFRITALSASITALLSLHFLAPESAAVFYERIFDTLIGATLAWLFSFLLPSWERRNVPKLVSAMLKADRDYAAQALLRVRSDQVYRLARKRAHDATANLATTVRRLADEPRLDRRALAALQDLLAANYLLASDLASMRVLFRLRAKELEPAPTDAQLDSARRDVEQALAAPAGASDVPARISRRAMTENLGGANAMISLRRRLVHIERTAERVAALAAKAIGMA
jgi:uncharacterized membrane protein YccC